MSDNTVKDEADKDPHDIEEGRLARMCYVLCLLGWVLGVTTWFALMIAYFAQGRSPTWVQGHYRFIIRTFWLPFVGFAIAALPWLLIASVSQFFAYATLFLGIVFAVLWMIVREVKGLKKVNKGMPISNPNTLMFDD